MSFLQPILLYGLPLALLPVLIHLINQHRHRTVQWAAMMFLLDAKKMTKGMARLRQIMILAMRVLAVLAILFAASRPLASGWVALTAGGEPETVLVLLDRSASMEQQNLETGESKRSTALEKISELLEKTGRRSRVTLIDSATLESTALNSATDLLDLPVTGPTDTAADIPALLQAALDFVSTNGEGRTDVWLASDLRAEDWEASSGRWESLRAGFSGVEGLRFYLLNYPDTRSDNLSIQVDNVSRRRAPEGLELVMDLNISRQSTSDVDLLQQEDLTVPLEITINGTRTVKEMTIPPGGLNLQGHTIPLGSGEPRGWVRIDLPADGNNRDNTYYFVFDEAPVRKTVIFTDDAQVGEAIRAAASAAVDSGQEYTAEVLNTSRIAEIPWDDTALLFWHAPLPGTGSAEATLLEQFVDNGKSLILLPTDVADAGEFLGFQWSDWKESGKDSPLEISWWQTDSELLGNTQNGNPLPLGELKLFQTRLFSGETQALLRLEENEEVISRLVTEKPGSVYIWGTLPKAAASSLASDGVAFFVMIHRALDRGANFLANAQQRETGPNALPQDKPWTTIDTVNSDAVKIGLNSGAFSSEDRLAAINRPVSEDDLRTINEPALEALFGGLDFQIIRDELGSGDSLASEIWRAFLVAMALALLIEAALCIPPRTEPKKA